MATVTIRNLDDEVVDALKRRASASGRSMESEARRILADAVGTDEAGAGGLGSRIRARFAGTGELPTERAVDLPREVDLDA
ncbi:Arc family DNA-binding protein [Occultella glacieicola]|uniref:Arc family DNA-binding protein n=1 Tax=Occultella glacieicola TaxID=2518684 RepID=A0ABY2E653_9MICO|nr:Arc family DNA-binding protein [Occultella glacieicola]TDE96078.1 Arc family DNA-binding protein [Occultella glacieicola]